VQYQNLLSRSDDLKRYDCTGGSKHHPKCLYALESFEINVPDFQGGIRHTRRISSPADVFDYLDYAMRLVPEYDELEHLLLVSGIDICPVPLISPLSIELNRMYQFNRNGIPPVAGGYLDQTTIFIEAAGIMASEENRISKKASKNDGKR